MLKAAFVLAAASVALGHDVSVAAASETLPGGGFSSHQYSAKACVASAAAPGQMGQSAVQADCGDFVGGDTKQAPPSVKHPTATSAPSYLSCTYIPEAGFVPSMFRGVQNGDPGGPYVRSCESSPTPVDNSMASAPQFTMPVFVPPPSSPSSSSPSLAALAQSAAGNLHIAPPTMRLSPGLDQPQVVNAPAWFFLDPASWVPVSSSVTAGGVTMTVTATPVSATWTSGDGGSVTCAGPGTPYPVGDPNPPEQSPTCGRAFTRASAGFPGGVYPLKAQVDWQVTWRASTGESGTLPPTVTSTTAQVRVVEVQALVTGVRS